MFCINCGEKLGRGDRFCKNCGQDQELAIASSEENKDINLLESEGRDAGMDDNKSGNELISSNDSRTVALKKDSFLKKVFKGVGIGGLVLGGGFLSVLFYILHFLFVAVAGLSMIWLAITLFSEGSIIWGLVVLFIGTPIAIGLAGYFFIFFFALTILALIIWGVTYLFGFNVSFGSVWDSIWLIIKVLILGGMAFFGITSFVQAVKKNELVSFFKENWFYILIFFFLFWLFIF